MQIRVTEFHISPVVSLRILHFIPAVDPVQVATALNTEHVVFLDGKQDQVTGS